MDTIIFALSHSQSLLVTLCLVLGLMVGSFLNVVIYRSPISLYREWESMAKEVLIDRGFALTPPSNPVDNHPEKFNLVVPRSACPKCGHQITALENIPLISYLFLRGKCSQCKTKISMRYPAIELMTGLTFAFAALSLGFGYPLAFALVLTGFLITMSFIDIDHQILPDSMTLLLLWIGIVAALGGHFVDLKQAIIGAMVGYLSLWSVYWLFKIVTGKEGMGHGDFKLLAALGAFVGWQKVLLIIVLSAFVGAVIGGLMMAIQDKEKGTKIPFGPYLAVAGWLAFYWGDAMIDAYLDYAGL